MADLDHANVDRLLASVGNPELRNDTAAQLSKVAAKAEDDVLMQLSTKSVQFVSWLAADEPLVRAYTACILANIAFLEPGQHQVLKAGGVPPLVKLLKGKDDKKVTLHSTAAIQNLTYKNTQCCQAVLEQGGEKALKKLLQHKSEDVQQFAAGALANLQLYRRTAQETDSQPVAAAESSGSMPSIGGKGGKSVSRKVAKILRRRGNDDHGASGSGAYTGGADDAAMIIQACFRGMKGRKEFERKQRANAKKGNRYDVFRVGDVRAELSSLPPLGGHGGGHGDGMLRKLPGLPEVGGGAPPSGWPTNGRRPQRLAPIDQQVRSMQATKLPMIQDPHGRLESMPVSLPPMGNGPGRGLRPMGVR